MVAIEDLPEEMQRHVVGLPRDWVQLFWWVAIVLFLSAHPKQDH